MSVVIVEMSEMSDCKELYNRKPPTACVAFLYATFALCVAIFIWITNGEINVIVKGNAIVKTYENQDTQLLGLETEDEYWIEIPITSCDIQRVEIGMTIRCSLDALPAFEYGYIEGKVIDISEQLYIDNEGQGYYIVKACPESTALTGSNGKAVSLQGDMIGQVSILTGTQKVLNYLYECMK